MIDFLKYSINEIESANLKINEDIELEKEFLVLSNQEKIFDAIERSYNILYQNEPSVYSELHKVINILNEIEKFDNSIVNIKQRLEEIYYQIEDIFGTLREYKSKFNFSPARLDEIIQRIETIKKLKKKYGNTIEEIINYKKKAIQDLSSIEQNEEEIEKTKNQIKLIETNISKMAIELSEKRQKVAKLLEEKMEMQLAELNMEKTTFKVNFTYQEDENSFVEVEGKKYKISASGIDNVEFLISPNIGEELRPLRKIASGGEISRIMLGLKTILCEVDKIDTLIFDEIDVGIGGKTSDKIGQMLKTLGKTKQVISVTHQPQISRYANAHFVVSKEIKEKRTFTTIKEVKGEERIYEIARMLSGEKITETSLKTAKEFIDSV
jgi:DNA repair protein RecN (Recombination protein N)